MHARTPLILIRPTGSDANGVHWRLYSDGRLDEEPVTGQPAPEQPQNDHP